ncbi:hypothetical protein QBC38DRAFT_183796 [Podospora fimiseda]|uniref:C2H2-type domain-containing protein n=1 Tax=Podospora fimiseda TaxID=252190 RepID=A0AAN7BQR7_9PEZI|nr:hypothetical protein QBC38DRAFT_183796 [Podospora fimiseda]
MASSFIDAILDDAPDYHLKAVLQALGDSDPQIKYRINTGLKMLDTYGPEEIEDHDTKRKREVPILYLCARPNCQEPFIAGDNDTNTEESCQYHPGELEFDESSDAWEGWTYQDDGVMDSEASREINPSGFRYSCCDETGEEKDGGCVFDRHLPTPARGHKRHRKA